MNCPECGSDQLELADDDLVRCMNCGTQAIPDPDLAAEDALWRDGVIRKGSW